MSLTVDRVEYFDKDGVRKDVSYRNMTPQEIHALAINKGPTGSEAYMKEIVKLTKEVAEGQARTNVVNNSPKDVSGRLLSNPYSKDLDTTIDALMQNISLEVAAFTGDTVAQQRLEGIVQGGGTPPSDQGGGAPPPSGGGMGSPPPTAGAGTPPFTGGTDPTKFRDPNINPYLTEQDNIRYDDSWRNIAMANGTQFNTLTQPYEAGNAAMMSLPDAFYNAFTPAQYGGLLSTANVGGIAPIFRSPFYDYVNRAGLSYGLGDPTRAAIQGSRGFADYLGTQQAPMSTADIWGNVANLMSPQGLQGYDENTQQFLRSQYGIGQGGDVKPRTELAFNLLSQDINPLWRQGYTDLLQREFARAQLSNPIYTSQPLSWALNRRLGMTPTLNEAGWAQALTPQFDSSGNVMGGGPMGGQGY